MRSLHGIACEIRVNWKKPYFGAVPYIDAMLEMSDVASGYGADTGADIVLRFLSNATTWRGDVARRVKAELKGMVK